MSGKFWTPDRIAECRELLRTMSRAGVARHYGVTSERIRQVIAKDDRRIEREKVTP